MERLDLHELISEIDKRDRLRYLLNNPALLFGQIDFHHIAGSVHRDGLDKAFEKIERQSPDYARYLFWFFQEQALNVWRPDFPDRLNSRLADHGLAL